MPYTVCGLSLLLVLSLCSKRIFSRYSGFPLSSKTNTSKFQFDLERTDTFKQVHEYELLCASWVNKQFTFFFLLYHFLQLCIAKTAELLCWLWRIIICTSLCLAPGERGQAYSTPGIWPNVFSFGWGIERDLTKLKIPRVGIFDKVAKEPEATIINSPPPPQHPPAPGSMLSKML